MKKFEVFGIKGLAFQKLLCWISQTLSYTHQLVSVRLSNTLHTEYLW